jgi:pyrroline-5-carboxylate reductase
MKTAIIGAGNMGGSIARGLAKGTIIPASDIIVSNPTQGKLDALKAYVQDWQTFSDSTCHWYASSTFLLRSSLRLQVRLYISYY